eukprot:Em0004g940a
MPGAPTDTRCAVSNPPQSWTNPMLTNNFGSTLYSNMSNTLRANEIYSISGTIYQSDSESPFMGPALSSIGAKQYDVPETELCISGKLDATTARQIQCNLGLRKDCGSIAPPTQPSNVTINPASTLIPAPNPKCDLPQTASRSDSLQLCIESLPNNVRRIFVYAGVDPSNPNLQRTCAKLACDTGRDIAEATGMPGAPTDTRCAVSNPPQSWTNPMLTNNFGSTLYSNMSNTLRANEIYSISGTIYQSDSESPFMGPALSSIGAKQYDVPETELCISGKLDATTARQIQCNLGLRKDCGSIAPPTQPSNVTINPASTLIPAPNPKCDLPQTASRSDSLQLCIESLPNNVRRIFVYAGVDPSNPNLQRTCAKLACDTGRDIAEATGMPGAPTDTRCAVSNPPQSWTNPMLTNNFGSTLYSNMSNTLRANEIYSISGTIYQSDSESPFMGPALSSIGAKQYDVPETELCISGKLDATTARQIQCNLGLRKDCGSIAPPTQPSNVTINPASTLIPAPNPKCDLPQTASRSDSLQLCIESLPNNVRRIFVYAGVDPSNPNLQRTCAKLACDTGRDIAEATGMPGAPTDTRCAVSNPPQSWTNPMLTNNFGSTLYSNMSNTLRANEIYSISGTIYQSDSESPFMGPALSSIGAKQYDVPETELCISGKLDATTARQIQCNLGLRKDCGSIAPPTQPSNVTINPASTLIPAPNPKCDLPQTASRSDSLQLCIESLPNNVRRIFVYAGVDPSNPNLQRTCAKLACDTGRDIAEATGMPGAPTDTRCAVSNPPQSWTNPMLTNNFGSTLYSNMSNTLRANEIYSISGTIYQSDSESPFMGPALSSIGAKQYDVPETELCISGKLDATTARQIQCNLGLRKDCGSIAPPTQPSNVTINPASTLIPTLKHQDYVLSFATSSSEELHETTTSHLVNCTIDPWDWNTINPKQTQELKPVINADVASTNVILNFGIIGVAVAVAVLAAY